MQLENAHNLDLIKAQLGLGSEFKAAEKAARMALGPSALDETSGGLRAGKTATSPSSSKTEKARKQWSAALDFESMFLGQMYKSMRQSNSFGSDAFGSELTEASPGRDIFTEMLDQEYAKQHAKSPLEKGDEGMRRAMNGMSNSLAAQIYRAMMRNDGETAPQGDDVSSAFSPMTGLARVLGARDPKVLGGKPTPALGETELNGLLDLASSTYGVSRDLIQSVVKNESANRPMAVSTAGAKGLMQLMDSTARDMGVANVFNPKENVLAGTRYLKQLLDRYQGDEKLAVAAYNAGPAQVDRYKGIPPFAETQDYVKRVLETKSGLEAARKAK